MMNSIEEKIVAWYRGIKRSEKTIFITVLMIGILTHGFAMNNLFIYHDATAITGSVGLGFGGGRWVMPFVGKALELTVGIYQLPLFAVLGTLFCIALSGVIIIRLFDIRNAVISALIGAIMAVFPVVTSVFAYMFVAVPQFASLLFSVLGISIILKRTHWKQFVIGMLLIITSLGMYQAYISVAVTIAVIYYLADLLFAERDIKGVVREGVITVLGLLLCVVLYSIITSLFCQLMGIELGTYQGMNEMGASGLVDRLKLIPNTYVQLFRLDWSGMNGTPFMKGLALGGISLTLVLAVIRMIEVKRDVARVFLSVILVMVMPLAINLVYVLSSGENYNVHTLMRYALVFVFTCPLIFLQKFIVKNANGRNQLMMKWINYVAITLIGLVIVCFIYSDNASYLRMTVLQNQTASYFSTLVTRIKLIEGYNDDLQVLYIGEEKIEDKTFTNLSFEIGNTVGFQFTSTDMLNDYRWKRFMYLSTGFSPREIEVDEWQGDKESISAMPCYPDDGSIELIDDIVVVKLGEMD